MRDRSKWRLTRDCANGLSARRAGHRFARFAMLALCAGACGIVAATPDDDRLAADPALRQFVDSQHAEAVAIELGRLSYRKRWNEVLDEALYEVAPRGGAWNDRHPAWAPARVALERLLREESVRWLAAHRDEVRRIVNEQSMRGLTDDERAQTTAFYQSSAGKVFLATRETFLRERAYGLPLEIEAQPLADVTRAHTAAQKVLLALPEDGDGKVIYDFFHGGPGDKLQKLQIEQWGAIVANVYSNTPEAYFHEHKAELVAALHAAVPGIPAASDKTYLGTVAMGADRSLTVVVENHQYMRLMGKYTLVYAPADVHWNDLAMAAPGIRPGETRPIYRDRAGQLSDRP